MKCLLQLYLAFYVQFSWHTLFTKAMPTNYRIRHDFNYPINEREMPETCLTKNKGSISHHIMPLVINSFRGRHTHMQTYRHCGQKQFQETSHVPVFGRCTWFKKLLVKFQSLLVFLLLHHSSHHFAFTSVSVVWMLVLLTVETVVNN